MSKTSAGTPHHPWVTPVNSEFENDWLDTIVMLPDQLFYNTGIFTYIWLLRNEKPASHRGRVMIIDARQQFEKEAKSFGNKRNRITDTHRNWIEQRYRDGTGTAGRKATPMST